jgi:hypothetical protein
MAYKSMEAYMMTYENYETFGVINYLLIYTQLHIQTKKNLNKLEPYFSVITFQLLYSDKYVDKKATF